MSVTSCEIPKRFDIHMFVLTRVVYLFTPRISNIANFESMDNLF